MTTLVLRYPATWLLMAVSLLPAGAGLATALVAGSDADALARVVATPGIVLSIASSLWTGIIATALALAAAHTAVALAAAGGWRRRLDALALPLLAMPHLALGIGLALVLAPSGIVLRLLSPWATGFEIPPDWLTVNDPAGLSLLLGLVLKETCFLILALVAALAQVRSEDLFTQARTLGYGRLKGWLVVVAPRLQQQIRLPLAAVLVFAVSNVEMAIPLGPRLPPTFPVLLWRWFTDPDSAVQAQAYAGSLMLFGLSVAVLGAAALAGTGLRRLLSGSARSGRRFAHDGIARTAASAALAVGWTVGILAIVALVLRAGGGAWRFPALLPTERAAPVWPDVVAVLTEVAPTTLGLAIATAVAGLLLVLPAAERCRLLPAARRHIGSVLFLPLLLPQMTFLFGAQVLLVRLGIDGTITAVLWTHLVFALPYLWGILAPARAFIDPRYAEVATTLGARPPRVWLTVTAPLLLRSTLVALALAFSVSVALYLPTLFAGAGRVATAATEAAAAAASGNLRLGAAYALLMATAPLAAFGAAYVVGALLFRQRRGVPR